MRLDHLLSKEHRRTLPSLSGSCPQYYLCLCPSLLFCGVRGVGVGVEPGCGTGWWGGWHTVGCLRDQMPRLPELVLILLGGGWVGFWA